MTHGQGRKSDADYLLRIADNIPGGRTICAFGEACSWPVQSFVRKFKDEFEAKGAAHEAKNTATLPGAGPSSEMKIAASPRS
jgi:NADH-quinone oxidoreductase subunit F